MTAAHEAFYQIKIGEFIPTEEQDWFSFLGEMTEVLIQEQLEHNLTIIEADRLSRIMETVTKQLEAHGNG